jgi:hypothetical protein
VTVSPLILRTEQAGERVIVTAPVAGDSAGGHRAKLAASAA